MIIFNKENLRIIIITQDEPFYLKENLEYLVSKLPSQVSIVACVLSDPSPFGKKQSFLSKTFTTIKVFGLKFFIRYGFKFLIRKIKGHNISKLLQEKQIPILPLKGSINSSRNLEAISKFKPDLLLSILGNQIFKKNLIDLAPLGCLNLHTALLPKYRGLMPTFWVLKNNETHTGVSVFYVDEGIDSGPIISQRGVPIGNMTQEELIKCTKKIGMELLVEAINCILENNVVLIPNRESEKSYYSFPTRSDVIEFKKLGKRFF